MGAPLEPIRRPCCFQGSPGLGPCARGQGEPRRLASPCGLCRPVGARAECGTLWPDLGSAGAKRWLTVCGV